MSFFINNQASDRDSDHFLASVTRQLESLVDPTAAGRTPGAAYGDYLRLLDVAAKCVSDRRQLILLVDGLDEDEDSTSHTERPTIARLLPKKRVNGLHVIAATRSVPNCLTAMTITRS